MVITFDSTEFIFINMHQAQMKMTKNNMNVIQ